LGMKTAPAYANFIFTDTGMDSIKLVKELEKRGILIRPAVNWGFPTCVRISIGTQAENEKLVKAIQEIKDEI
ncbi:MAG: histidinol-phosphate transaminase, partial [Clostridia bacterium]|nr:histidinol-phosphate transaminase [Clostridia bacterium]